MTSEQQPSYVAVAGNNKFAFKRCPFCKAEGDHAIIQQQPRCVFYFRDELSLSEYRISGLCQKCQDGIFDNHDQAKVN